MESGVTHTAVRSLLSHPLPVRAPSFPSSLLQTHLPKNQANPSLRQEGDCGVEGLSSRQEIQLIPLRMAFGWRANEFLSPCLCNASLH